MSWRVSRRYPLYLAPGARINHEGLGWKALDLASRVEAKIVSNRFLYLKNLKGSWRMRFAFSWLMVGIVGEAFLSCFKHRSTLPLRGLRRGFDKSLVVTRGNAPSPPLTGSTGFAEGGPRV